MKQIIKQKNQKKKKKLVHEELTNELNNKTITTRYQTRSNKKLN